MLDLLRTAIRRLNVNLALTMAGLVLALFAIWFDFFGFRTDRTENIQTTETLEKLLEENSNPEVQFLRDSNAISEEQARYEVSFLDNDSRTCVVGWKNENDEYSAVYAHNAYSIEVHRPEFQPFLSSSFSHGLFALDDLEAEEIMFVDTDGCEYVVGHDDKDCFHLEIDEAEFPIISLFQKLIIRPDEDGLEDLRVALPTHALYRREFEQAAINHIAKLQEKLDEYDLRADEIENAGGKLEEFGFTWIIAEQQQGQFKFHLGGESEFPQLTIRTQNLASAQNSAVLAYKNGQPDDYSVQIRPVLPDLDYWVPDLRYQVYDLEMDQRGVSDAQLILNECAVRNFQDNEVLYRAFID